MLERNSYNLLSILWKSCENGMNDTSYFAERDARWKKIRQAMKEMGIDCLVVWEGAALACIAANLKYLSDVLPGRGYLVFPLEGEPTLISFMAQGRNTGIWKSRWVSDIRAGHPYYDRAICQRIKELHLENRTIGIVSSTEYWNGFGIPHSTYTGIVSELKEARIVDATPLIEDARMIKSEWEIANLDRAAQIGVDVIESIRRNAKPGVDHAIVKRSALDTMYDNGAELGNLFLYSFGFEGIIHGGSKSGLVVDPAAREAVKENQIILTEFAVQYHGYVVQYNQPFVAGVPSATWQRLFDTMFDAYERGFHALKPSITAGELNDIMLEPIQKAGYELENPPFHGLGLSIEEPLGTFPGQPLYKPNRSFVFKENMVLELEPPGYTPDMQYGMSLGDTVVVTSSGCRRLGKESKPEFVRTY